jgi:hypothetical protein
MAASVRWTGGALEPTQPVIRHPREQPARQADADRRRLAGSQGTPDTSLGDGASLAQADDLLGRERNAHRVDPAGDHPKPMWTIA